MILWVIETDQMNNILQLLFSDWYWCPTRTDTDISMAWRDYSVYRQYQPTTDTQANMSVHKSSVKITNNDVSQRCQQMN